MSAPRRAWMASYVWQKQCYVLFDLISVTFVLSFKKLDAS